jgi:hypothetical protein
MGDEITIEILPDGTIKTSTDKISMANHSNAEGFLREMARQAGGTVKRTAKLSQLHTHTHGGITHTH